MQREKLINNWKEELRNTNPEGVELMTKLFGGISKIEKYNINTTLERIEEIKRQEAEEETRKEQEREAERMNRPSPYSLNATMRMLGHQFLITPLEEYGDMFDEVMQAHPYEGTFDICADMFSLGVICGKRMDRKRRRNTKTA